MAIQLAKDFKEFLKLLNSNGVEYLLVGGHAVGIHGYVRATNDLDVWINATPTNAVRVTKAVREFGFTTPDVNPELFAKPDQVARMGVPPMRLEILTSISGASFDTCYSERQTVQIEEVSVPTISLLRLRQNKAAAGRPKDLADLDNLPTP
jgi:hypothetical protein